MATFSEQPLSVLPGFDLHPWVVGVLINDEHFRSRLDQVFFVHLLALEHSLIKLPNFAFLPLEHLLNQVLTKRV